MVMFEQDYPVEGENGKVATAALNRLGDFFAKTYPNLDEVDDPFLKDVLTVAIQANLAVHSLKAIAGGVFTSCEHEPKYAGGVVDKGNRIYTPAEGAHNQLNHIRSLG